MMPWFLMHLMPREKASSRSKQEETLRQHHHHPYITMYYITIFNRSWYLKIRHCTMHSRQEGPVDWQPKAEQIQTVAWQLTFDAVQVAHCVEKGWRHRPCHTISTVYLFLLPTSSFCLVFLFLAPLYHRPRTQARIKTGCKDGTPSWSAKHMRSREFDLMSGSFRDVSWVRLVSG